MRASQAIANKSVTSLLGSLGAGAAGSVTENFSCELNAAPIAAATSVSFASSAHVSKTGRVRVAAQMTLSKNSGTLAAGDLVTFTLSEDTTPIGGDQRVGAVTTGSDVTANVSMEWIDTPAPDVSHTYKITAAITGGHTGGILADECTIIVEDV